MWKKGDYFFQFSWTIDPCCAVLRWFDVMYLETKTKLHLDPDRELSLEVPNSKKSGSTTKHSNFWDLSAKTRGRSKSMNGFLKKYVIISNFFP